MTKIVIPIDFSAAATKAVSVAAQLTRLLHADLHLVHVLAPAQPGNGLFPDDAGAQYRDALGRIEEAYDALQRLPCLSGLRVHTHVLPGTDPVDILSDKRFSDADLLVLSSTGARGLKELLPGSNAEHLVRQATMPVLVLKNPPAYLDLKTVVFASNFNDHYTTSIDFLKTLLDCFEYPALHLLFVNTLSHFVPGRESQQRMETFASQHGLSGCSFNQQDDFEVEAGLLDFASSKKADLIVLGTHGRRGLRHLLQGSIAEDVVNHASVAVLTLPLRSEHAPMVILEGIL